MKTPIFVIFFLLSYFLTVNGQDFHQALQIKGISLAETIAVKSQRIEDPQVAALLAKEAYDLYTISGGTDQNPYIYEGLYKAMSRLQATNDHKEFNSWSIPPKKIDHLGAVRSIEVAFIAEEKDQAFYTTGSDGYLLKWPLESFKNKEEQQQKGQAQLIASNPKKNVFRAMDLSPDGQLLVRGGDENYIEVYDLKKEERLLKINAHRNSRIWALEFLPNSAGIISAGDDRTINYSNLKGEVTTVVDKIPYRITSLALSGDGNYVAGAGKSPDVSIWDISNGQEKYKLENPYNKKTATAVAISPSGRFIATGYQDGALLIWDMKEWLMNKGDYRPDRLLYHNAKISDLTFSEDGTQLVVGSLDRYASLWKIWDKRFKGEENAREFPFKNVRYQPVKLTDQEDWVMTVAFTHDGGKVLTGMANGCIKMYETDMAIYAEQLCTMLKTNLSDALWKRYIGTDDPEKDPKKQKAYIETVNGKRFPTDTCGKTYPQIED